MSEHQQYLAERDKIDFYIQKGYRINRVNEHLNGASVDFVHPNGKDIETLLIGTPNGRKYFSRFLISHNQ